MSEYVCIMAEGCYLTEGKSYRALAIQKGWIEVVNDTGGASEYPIEWFKKEGGAV